jgi:hypothetical protein
VLSSYHISTRAICPRRRPSRTRAMQSGQPQEAEADSHQEARWPPQTCPCQNQPDGVSLLEINDRKPGASTHTAKDLHHKACALGVRNQTGPNPLKKETIDSNETQNSINDPRSDRI